MKIIVAGCGKIGTTIISQLAAEGHDVVALDHNPSVLAEITNIYDVMGLCGNCTNVEILEEAGAESARLFVAATGSDELNMLACFLARRMGAHHSIARIRNPEYNERGLRFVREQLNLSMSINPDMLAAQELFNILKLPSAVKIERFSGRNFEMIEMMLKPNSILNGMTVIEMRNKYKGKYLICVVQRGDDVYIPDGNFILHSGDRIGLTASSAEIQRLLRSLGVMQKQARSVMILGGSRTAVYLARLLINIGVSVKIIEQDAAVCRDLSETLPKAVIVNGDGAQQELLLEEGLRSTDAFISLTGMDEENILISIFAASQNVPTVISKVNRDELASMAGRLGIDCIVSPRKIVSDVLVRYARALQNSVGSNIETLYNLMDGKAEALEFNVKTESPLLGVPLKALSLKQNVLIAGIIRERKTIIPDGDDVIQLGDRVVVLSTNQHFQDFTDIIK
ncbi:MAG: Trk system potassium transporter TrkA [Firmicutes bacterium]|nr:Trk system potassium transporter TrkA [Bacillota bacterium]